MSGSGSGSAAGSTQMHIGGMQPGQTQQPGRMQQPGIMQQPWGMQQQGPNTPPFGGMTRMIPPSQQHVLSPSANPFDTFGAFPGTTLSPTSVGQQQRRSAAQLQNPALWGYTQAVLHMLKRELARLFVS